ncbi:alpha/beta hydrolase [Vibrio alginolyticus]|nr:alpha/beta hydrolase [Vibrio alginolyticus]EGR1571110.1 alpha/beta hydrolase [Vibrio alginolyticus]
MRSMQIAKLFLLSLLVVGCSQTQPTTTNIHRAIPELTEQEIACESGESEGQPQGTSSKNECFKELEKTEAGTSTSAAVIGVKTVPVSACGGLGCLYGWIIDLFQEQEETYKTIEVFYATDRKIHSIKGNNATFTNDWADELSYGKTKVSIPGSHEIGEIERPTLSFMEDPYTHMLLQSTALLPKNEYFLELERRINKPGSLLVFVHGYNVSFEQAALRTGQMAFDLQFKGVPIFYSWPSKGEFLDYSVDENTMEWSKKHMESFLKQLLQETSAPNIYLIGHSLGTRGLTQAYIEVMETIPEAKSRIKEVILAAPDIDARVFGRDIAPHMKEIGAPVTLYVSSQDNALKFSEFLHGSSARAGSIGKNALADSYSGIETVDVSALGIGFLNHSTFAETRPIINDMFGIINYGKRAAERAGLDPIQTKSGTHYWKMRK